MKKITPNLNIIQNNFLINKGVLKLIRHLLYSGYCDISDNLILKEHYIN